MTRPLATDLTPDLMAAALKAAERRDRRARELGLLVAGPLSRGSTVEALPLYADLALEVEELTNEYIRILHEGAEALQ